MIVFPWHNEPFEYVLAAVAVLCVAGAGLLASAGLGALMPALIPAKAFRRVFGVAVMAALVAEAFYMIFYPGGEYANYGAAWGLCYMLMILTVALLLGSGLALAGRIVRRRRVK